MRGQYAQDAHEKCLEQTGLTGAYPGTSGLKMPQQNTVRKSDSP